MNIALLLSLLVPAGATARGSVTSGGAYVDPTVLSEASRNGVTDAWIVLSEQADLSGASEIKDWDARGQYVYDTLTQTARETQASLRAELDRENVSYRSFWIVNAIQVTTNEATIEYLSERPEVAQILPAQDYELPELIPAVAQFSTQAVEWGVEEINAPDVWSTPGVRGEGIVVGSIDTGAQFDHPALVAQYRGNLGGGVFDHDYNWLDPSEWCPDPQVPCDNHGHGTHTIGTMIGDDGADNQIGVAPGATWIAAKGCESRSCSDAALLTSGQWMLAPTRVDGSDPDPSMRPHLINNSWGGGGGDAFYQHVVDAWVAAGIFPVFANGNEGPACFTSRSPGDYLNAYSVGAYASNGSIAGFSSRGPSPYSSEIKPNISAPGVNVRSSVPDNSYAPFNGTSMAAPHVAGTVALIWSARPALIGDIDTTRELLDQTAIDTEDLQCGGTAADNNVFGEGKLDAAAAVAAALNLDFPPQADAGGPYSGDEGSPIDLSGSASDVDSPTLTSTWSITAGAPCAFDDASALATTITCTDDGEFTVTLTATDGTTPVSASATLSVANLPPAINDVFTNAPVPQGQPVTVTVLASDPGTSDVLSYGFDCDADPGYEIGPQLDNSASCALDPSQASLTIGVQVTDDEGASVSGSITVSQTLALCANRYTGELSLPASNGSCPSGSSVLTMPAPSATTLCISAYTGAITWSARGTCGVGGRVHIVPDDGPLHYCRSLYTGTLRYSATGACSASERPGVIPG